MIGGCPWVHPRGQPNTPTPPQTPFLPSGTHSTNSDTVPVARGSDGAPFFGFFYPSMTINPTLYAASARHGNSQCLVKMVLYGITGYVDIDARSLCCTLAFAIGIRDFSPMCKSDDKDRRKEVGDK